MAKYFIEESGLESYTVRRNMGTDNFVASITNTFREAKENAPCIVFLDDMDKFANEDEKHCDAKEYVAVQAGIDEAKESDPTDAQLPNQAHRPLFLFRPDSALKR